jgi:hypothetical protein
MPTLTDTNKMLCSDGWGKAVRSNLQALEIRLKNCDIDKAEKIWRSLIRHAINEQKRREKADA